MIIKIGTLNCQNNEDNRLDRNNNTKMLSEHILNENYDILGTQELTINFAKKLGKMLKDYSVYGDYQYGRGIIGTKIPIIKQYNQANPIITNLDVENVRTYVLPWFPRSIRDLIKGLKKCSITKRIITKVQIDKFNEKIFIFNTHLDYYISNVQKRQLKYILRKIKRYRRYGNVVLMGDFNLHIKNELFIWFIDELKKIDIVRVPVNDKTNAMKYKARNAIDHIFIPTSWNIIEYGIINEECLDSITDHKAVYVVVDIPD